MTFGPSGLDILNLQLSWGCHLVFTPGYRPKPLRGRPNALIGIGGSGAPPFASGGPPGIHSPRSCPESSSRCARSWRGPRPGSVRSTRRKTARSRPDETARRPAGAPRRRKKRPRSLQVPVWHGKSPFVLTSPSFPASDESRIPRHPPLLPPHPFPGEAGDQLLRPAGLRAVEEA